MIAAHLRHQARSSEWGCTPKYTPIQPNFDLAPHLHHSHAKRLALPRTTENDWERLGFSAVSSSRRLVVSSSRRLVVSSSRGLAVSQSRGLAVSQSCGLVGAPLSHSQVFPVFLSLSQSIARPSANRAPLSRSHCNPLNKKIGASQTRGSEMEYHF